MQKISKEKQNNIWTKIKGVLKRKGIKGKDKIFYKEKVGFNLIDNNKLLYNELITWIGIYNEYRQKMPLFYTHSKQYLPLFQEINNRVYKIQNVNYYHYI